MEADYIPPYFGDQRQLKLVGITYNQIESGVYAVILEEVGGNRRIPIIIGYPEAQAIECKLQEITPPRPLTHDLMVTALEEFGVTMNLVEIYKMPNGVFGAHLHMRGPEGPRTIDSRSSDAIALAIRMNTPIVTSAQVLDDVGFVPEESADPRSRRPAATVRVPTRQQGGEPETVIREENLGEMSLKQLHAIMQTAADSEDYELAARIKAEIDRRSGNENAKDEDTEKV